MLPDNGKRILISDSSPSTGIILCNCGYEGCNYSSVVDHLPAMPEVLGSIPSTGEKKWLGISSAT